jgi:8-oxo-dGTP diphosphatase
MQTVLDHANRPWTHVHGTWGNEQLLEQYDSLAALDNRYGPLVDAQGHPITGDQLHNATVPAGCAAQTPAAHPERNGTVDIETKVGFTVDAVVLAEHHGALHVLVIHRRWPPHQGRAALPGGYVEPAERSEDAVRRELREETGIDVPRWRRLDVYDDPHRDPRGRVVSVAYLAQLPGIVAPTAGDDASAARWARVDALLADPDTLAFDHAQILADAMRRRDG